jgi:hypothetical protein
MQVIKGAPFRRAGAAVQAAHVTNDRGNVIVWAELVTPREGVEASFGAVGPMKAQAMLREALVPSAVVRATKPTKAKASKAKLRVAVEPVATEPPTVDEKPTLTEDLERTLALEERDQ